MKRFEIILSIVFVVFYSHFLCAQVAINKTGLLPDSSAILDVQSDEKGMLVPRMNTSHRTAISNPADGLLVFDSTTKSFWFFITGSWVELINRDNSLWQKSGSNIYYTDGNVGIGTDTPKRLLHNYTNNSEDIVAPFIIEQGGSGDAFLNIGLTGSSFFSLGVDQSDAAKFKIGYHPSKPYGLDLDTRLTIEASGQIGIGANSPLDRLQVDAGVGEGAFRARINGNTKLRVHSNGGSSFGENATPPVDGIRVKGELQANGNISSIENLQIESKDEFVYMVQGTDTIKLDTAGITQLAESDLLLKTDSANNKIELHKSGISQTSSGNILIETEGTGTAITIKAGDNEITVTEDGNISITTGGNDLSIHTEDGDINLDAGDGNVNIDGYDINLTASNTFNALSDNDMNFQNTAGIMDFNSATHLSMMTSMDFSVTSGMDFSLESGLLFDVSSGSTMDISSSGVMSMDGPTINLNNNSNGLAAARLSDGVQVNLTSGFGNIKTASSTVFIGD